jgi:hypothetical protein
MLSFGASLLFESEIEHMEAKYEFEAGNLDKAFEIWQNLVKQKGVGYRYFEYDDSLLFFVFPNEQWNKLEKEQGKTKLNKYFHKITLNSKMFSLQYDVVEYLRLKKILLDLTVSCNDINSSGRRMI